MIKHRYEGTLLVNDVLVTHNFSEACDVDTEYILKNFSLPGLLSLRRIVEIGQGGTCVLIESLYPEKSRTWIGIEALRKITLDKAAKRSPAKVSWWSTLLIGVKE
jgi:hypothetical protein